MVVMLFTLCIIGEKGKHRSDLVNWYLSEVENDLEDEQELIDTKLLVDMVIDRLIRHVSNVYFKLTVYVNRIVCYLKYMKKVWRLIVNQLKKLMTHIWSYILIMS